MKKYLISGIKDSNSGVGRLLKNLVQYAKKNDYQCLFKPRKYNTNRSILYKNRDYFGLIKETFFRITYLFRFMIFVIRLYSIKNHKVVVIHPQTLGYFLFFQLLKFNELSLYVVDNSFFCIESRNFRPDIGECFDCIGDLNNCHKMCTPKPVQYNKQKNLNYLKKLMECASQIKFFTQNHNQARLLNKHFNDSRAIEVIGMNTGEIDINEIVNNTDKIEITEQNKIWPEIVYHGVVSYVKGIEYFLQLIPLLKNYTFFIPESKITVEKFFGFDITYDNLIFDQCNWDTGLKNYVANSKLTICPSIWSAPIEGSLIKSIANSPKAAGVITKYGFINEIPDDIVLKLEIDPLQACRTISNYLENTTKYDNSRARNYINNLLNDSKIKLNKLFE